MQIVLDRITLADVDNSRDSDVLGKHVTLEPGEWVNLVAASGGGKTTLLQSLYGCRDGIRGTILFDGKNSRSLSRKQWRCLHRRHLGILFQDLRLFPELTGRENIILKADLTGAVPTADIESMADTLGILAKLDNRCATMSQGEKQRIAIARALSQPLDWLLLDEPFSHLDGRSATAAAELIMTTCKRHEAGIIITSLAAETRIQPTRQLRLREAGATKQT